MISAVPQSKNKFYLSISKKTNRSKKHNEANSPLVCKELTKLYTVLSSYHSKISRQRLVEQHRHMRVRVSNRLYTTSSTTLPSPWQHHINMYIQTIHNNTNQQQRIHGNGTGARRPPLLKPSGNFYTAAIT